MQRTFTTMQAANEYVVQEENAGSVAITHEFGDKFRVYVETKDKLENVDPYIWPNMTLEQIRQKARWHLRDSAWREHKAVKGALTIRKMIADLSVFNDYESIIEAAHILMEESGEFKSGRELMEFIDFPNKHQTMMEEFIRDVLDQYEYEPVGGEMPRREAAK